MKELLLLYWGCIFLMYLSQVYNPSDSALQAHAGRSFMWFRVDLFMVLVVSWMTCFSFLRTSYNDTYTYISYWYQAPTVKEYLRSGELLKLAGNPLSDFWGVLAHSLVQNYHVYFLPPALLSSFAVVQLFRRYSVNPAMSLLIFFSIGTYIMYVAALKQCFAIFFLLLALPYALDRKYVRFYLLVALAILFHTHAFMFALVPFLTDKPWKRSTWIGIGVMLFLIFTYRTTMRGFLHFAQALGALVAEEEVFDGHQINFLRILVYWVPGLLALCFHQRLFCDSTPAENLFVNMSIVTAEILSIGLVEGANLYARMAGYFEISVALALPWMLSKLFTRQSAQYLTAIASAFYFTYFLYEFGIAKSFDSEYTAISLWQFITDLVTK